jgi:hypothetical protein
MADLNDILDKAPPRSLAEALADWPARDRYEPSPNDWRDEIIYFLLPDRFSNGQEAPDRLLDIDLSAPEGISRIRALRGAEWRWDKWQFSGANRFQGGTLAGIRSKLDYLADLGITTLWIAPVSARHRRGQLPRLWNPELSRYRPAFRNRQTSWNWSMRHIRNNTDARRS